MAGTKVFQIAGYQNSGKTTLIENMILEGKSRRLTIGTIKHHGHGGAPAVPKLEKDTDKHRDAGADAVCVYGEETMVMEVHKRDWTPHQLIRFFQGLGLDFVFLEGFKKEAFPKVVLIRSPQDEVLLKQLSEIRAVLAWIPVNNEYSFPIYKVEETDRFIRDFYSGIFLPE
ncbi:MAG TPA: molybdopterin-guanine dinucleotide biosynthesis protein B [Bacillaceae bacterium]